MGKVVGKLVFSLVGICLVAAAQNTAGTASISGTVVDATGSAVPDATVVIENESKGIRRALAATDSGVFNVSALVPAAGYTVAINKAGFAKYQATDITLNVDSTVKPLRSR